MAAVPETTHCPAPGKDISHFPWLDYSEDAFVNQRGIHVYIHSWVNKEKPVRDLVFLQHGYSDHSNGHIAELACLFAQEGFACFALDCQGCGYSRGDRMHVERFGDYVDDLIQFRNMTVGRYQGKRAFLYGESMGGAISLLTGLREPGRWSGLLLVAPMIRIADSVKPPAWQIPILKAMAWVAPKWAVVPEKQDMMTLCFKDPVVAQQHRTDPLMYHGKTRLGTAYQLLAATEELHPQLARMRDPFVVFHGTSDMMTDPSQSQELFRTATSTDKTAIYYQGFYHALFAEPNGGGQRFVQDAIAWLTARSGSAPTAAARAQEIFIGADLKECAPFAITDAPADAVPPQTPNHGPTEDIRLYPIVPTQGVAEPAAVAAQDTARDRDAETSVEIVSDDAADTPLIEPPFEEPATAAGTSQSGSV